MNRTDDKPRADEQPIKPRQLKSQPGDDARVEALKRKLEVTRALCRDLAAWIQRKHKAGEGEEKCNFTK